MSTPTKSTPASAETLAKDSVIYGLLSFIPFISTPFLALAAIITGHKALMRLQVRRTSAICGLGLGYLNLGLCVYLLWGAINASARYAPRVQCSRQLAEVGQAAQIWAMEHGGALPKTFLEMSNELGSPKVLICPGDSNRLRHGVGTKWDRANFTYEYVLPGRLVAEVASNVIIGCPIHGAVVLGNGAVSWPPLSDIKE